MKQNILLAVLVLLSPLVNSQNLVLDTENSSITITGTSSLHDWHSDVELIQSKGGIILNNETLDLAGSFEIIIPVKSIKGEKSGMDKRTYEALKEESFPEILFKVSNIETGSNDVVKVSGDLSIAGKTVKQEMSFTKTSEYDYTGTLDISLLDYDIEPPTALLGTIKVGEVISINVNAVFKAGS